MGYIRQVKVRFIADDRVVGGILLTNGTLICGCCGGIVEDSDDYEIVEEYKNWVNISESIIGE